MDQPKSKEFAYCMLIKRQHKLNRRLKDIIDKQAEVISSQLETIEVLFKLLEGEKAAVPSSGNPLTDLECMRREHK